jgi:fumarate hydratase subunit alpha
MFAKIEEDLYEALNSLGIGIMGAGGNTSVLGVNVEYAYTHIAGIAVATSTNCMVARRATSRIDADGTVSVLKSPNWFEGR